MKHRRILLLSGWRIFPTQTGGHLRSASLAQALARMGHEVSIFSLAARMDDYKRGVGPLLQTLDAGLREEVHRGWAIGLLQALGRRLGWPRLWQYYLLQRGWLPRRLKLAIEAADLIICDLPYCPPVPGYSHKSWYLLSHNLEQRLLEQGTPRERRAAAWMARVEAEAPQRYEVILACAAEDRDYFQRQAGAQGARVVLVPNGIDARLYQAAGADRTRIRSELGLSDEDWLIVFSGSHFEPNVEALRVLRSFCQKHAGFLEAHRLHFLILGSMQKQPRREGALLITGRVAETPPYFAAADAALNPITRGSGSNVKLFEYLAAQLPILSTGFGVRGTELREGRDFMSYEGEELQDRLLELVSSRSKSEWRVFAAAVWERHRSSCEMEEILRRVFSELEHGQRPHLPE